MPWELDNDRPIYLQLMERIQHDIISGVYKPGDKIPSVRDLALDAAVNPNTMQKALSELERNGLVYSQRTSGRFITDDEELLKNMKMQLATEHIRQFFEQMHQLGFSDAPGFCKFFRRRETVSRLSSVSPYFFSEIFTETFDASLDPRDIIVGRNDK